MGLEGSIYGPLLMEEFCKSEFVYTDAVLLENPISFPVGPHLGEYLLAVDMHDVP